jgi:hypothetical protein
MKRRAASEVYGSQGRAPGTQKKVLIGSSPFTPATQPLAGAHWPQPAGQGILLIGWLLEGRTKGAQAACCRKLVMIPYVVLISGKPFNLEVQPLTT